MNPLVFAKVVCPNWIHHITKSIKEPAGVALRGRRSDCFFQLAFMKFPTFGQWRTVGIPRQTVWERCWNVSDGHQCHLCYGYIGAEVGLKSLQGQTLANREIPSRQFHGLEGFVHHGITCCSEWPSGAMTTQTRALPEAVTSCSRTNTNTTFIQTSAA